MQKITIGFSTTKKVDLFSKLMGYLIRWSQGTQFSHTYLRYLSQDYERQMVVHASHWFVHTVTYEHFLKESQPLCEFEINVTKDVFEDIMGFTSDRYGVKYGFMQFVGMAYRILLKKLFNKTITNPLADGERTLVCSEFIGEILNLIDPTDFPTVELEDEGPKLIHSMILDYLENHKGVVTCEESSLNI